VGFAAVGFLVGETGDLALAAVLVSSVALLGALVVWWLPETAGRELAATSASAH
jgi:hypothetical protein